MARFLLVAGLMVAGCAPTCREACARIWGQDLDAGECGASVPNYDEQTGFEACIANCREQNDGEWISCVTDTRDCSDIIDQCGLFGM